jgi:transcriptional regulator with XRE-family HTH domain
MAGELMMTVRNTTLPATAQGPLDDEFGPYLDEAKRDPAFRTAYEDAEQLQRTVDTLVGHRRALGLSQKIVAERMGVRQPTVSGFENEGSDPRLSTLQRYARAVQARLRLLVDVPSACDWVSSSTSAYRASAPVYAHTVAVRSGHLAGDWRTPRQSEWSQCA